MAAERQSAADADDLCRAEFDERLGQAGTELGERYPETLREQSREALRVYTAELAPSVPPVSVERRFERRMTTHTRRSEQDTFANPDDQAALRSLQKASGRSRTRTPSDARWRSEPAVHMP